MTEAGGKEFWVITSREGNEPEVTLWWVDDNGVWMSAPVPPPNPRSWEMEDA